MYKDLTVILMLTVVVEIACCGYLIWSKIEAPSTNYNTLLKAPAEWYPNDPNGMRSLTWTTDRLLRITRQEVLLTQKIDQRLTALETMVKGGDPNAIQRR